MRYLFPTPGSPLRKLLDGKASRGEKFSEDEAAIDIMLALDRDDIKPQRYYAKRWDWPKSTVAKKLPTLLDTANGWRDFTDEQSVGKRGQSVGKRGQKAKRTAPKTQVRAQSVGKRGQSVGSIEQIQITDTERKREDSLVNGDSVMASWNDFATRTGLSPIQKITAARARAIKLRGAEIWPRLPDIYAKIEASDFLMGRKGNWRANFDFLWRPDSATKILEGTYDGTNGQATQRRVTQDYGNHFE